MSSDYLKDSYESALRENHELRRENLALQQKLAGHFTEDEIAQMKAETIRSYQAENFALADRVAALEVQLLQWQALGDELVAAFRIENYGEYIELVTTGNVVHIYSPSGLTGRCHQVLSRLLAAKVASE